VGCGGEVEGVEESNTTPCLHTNRGVLMKEVLSSGE
jgi:hypothetical protein